MIRSSVISLLVALVAGSCLPDAIPPSQRKNLVNLDGKSYPVGFFISNYAASFAANILGATLVEEVLGYNTTLNLDDLGSGTVAGYYGVTGCVNHSNANERGCMQGATSYHVHMESWIGGYPSDWDYIQKTYTSVAPKDLGSMGYDGLATMYMPKPIQEQAWNTSGKPLQFYRSWNTSWNTPWTFFGSISAINTSKLAPCDRSDISMVSDATMRRHIERTGDVDGVVLINGSYVARCDDGYFWTSPSCRANPSQCIPYITGGVGWSLEEFMQKSTILSMPLGIAVAASWTAYTEVPQSGTMTMYWWAPDPTFLELSPIKVVFPDYKAREWAEGLQTSEISAQVVSTIVSRDLGVLSPIVESFVDKIDMPMAKMDDILLDQKNTGDSWENVTCRWLQANRAIWQRWIPDESECFAGFGIYDSVLKEFANQRENATNKIVCEACPPGTSSQSLEDTTGVTYVCVPCAKGTSQSSGASLSCTPCHGGEYQDEVQSQECKRCPFGTYQDEEGQESCKACPQGTSTLGFGALALGECGCAAGEIDMDRTGGFTCVKCSEGMTCPAISQLADLENGTSANGPAFTPKIQKGYYATMENPTEIFKCGNPQNCPGGTPGSCAGGLVDTPCSQCSEGSTWTGSICEDCAGWRQALWVLAVIGIFSFLILAYYLTTSKVTAKATVLFATTASFGMLVMSMQNLGLIGMMTVEWPENLRGLFAVCQFLLLDIDSYGFSCVAGNTEPIRYLLSAMIFPVGVAWLLLGYGVSRLFAQKYHWEGPKVASTMGAFLQVGFSTMSATSLAPMMCYQHPNGQRSLLKYPGVICGSGDHSIMLVIGSLLLAVFVIGFVALCSYAVVKVPKWSVQRKDRLVGAVRFLVFRFRFDSWWFGVPLLVRGPLINLPVVLATDYPPIQVVSIAMVLTTMMVMQMLAWPWKVPLLNLTDCIISFCIVLLVTDSTLYLNKIDESMYAFASAVSTAMLSGIGVAVGIMIIMTCTALFYRSAMGGRKEVKFFNLGSTPSPEKLARLVKLMAEELDNTELEMLSTKLSQLPIFDINKVTTCITLLATEVAPPAEEGYSFKFNRRIASASFDPSLKRRPQSKRSHDGSRRNSKEETNTQQNENNVMLVEITPDEEPRHSDWI